MEEEEERQDDGEETEEEDIPVRAKENTEDEEEEEGKHDGEEREEEDRQAREAENMEEEDEKERKEDGKEKKDEDRPARNYTEDSVRFLGQSTGQVAEHLLEAVYFCLPVISIAFIALITFSKWALLDDKTVPENDPREGENEGQDMVTYTDKECDIDPSGNVNDCKFNPLVSENKHEINVMHNECETDPACTENNHEICVTGSANKSKFDPIPDVDNVEVEVDSQIRNFESSSTSATDNFSQRNIKTESNMSNFVPESVNRITPRYQSMQSLKTTITSQTPVNSTAQDTVRSIDYWALCKGIYLLSDPEELFAGRERVIDVRGKIEFKASDIKEQSGQITFTTKKMNQLLEENLDKHTSDMFFYGVDIQEVLPQESMDETYISTMNYKKFTIGTIYLSAQNMTLTSKAIEYLQNIEKLIEPQKCKSENYFDGFFKTFGSHVYQGTVEFGEIFISAAYSENFSHSAKEEMKSFTSVFSNKMANDPNYLHDTTPLIPGMSMFDLQNKQYPKYVLDNTMGYCITIGG